MDQMDYRDITERVEALWSEVAAAAERCERAMLGGARPSMAEYQHLAGISALLLALVAMCHARDDMADVVPWRNGRAAE